MLSFLGTTTGLSVAAVAAASVPSPRPVEVEAAVWAAGALEMLSMAAASSPVAAILFLFWGLDADNHVSRAGHVTSARHYPARSRSRSRALPRPSDAPDLTAAGGRGAVVRGREPQPASGDGTF